MKEPNQTPPAQSAELKWNGKSHVLPVVIGSEQEAAIDIAKLRGDSGLITLDPGYGNTGSCKSAITYIDGERGILRYRGYPIEELAEHSTFLEVAWLLMRGELPSKADLAAFRSRVAPRLDSDAVIRDQRDAGEQINAAIGRAQRFLTLASLVTVVSMLRLELPVPVVTLVGPETGVITVECMVLPLLSKSSVGELDFQRYQTFCFAEPEV